MKTLIAIALCASMAGCATTQTGSLCTIGPFIPDQGVTERWTRGEKEQLVTLNTSGEQICGWHSPR